MPQLCQPHLRSIGILAGLFFFVFTPALAGDTSLSTAPDFKSKGLDGKEYQLSELLKKGPVFLDFWTTWCKPCLQELPELQKIYKKYADQGFTLLTVASDDQRTVSKVKPLAKSRKFDFPILVDPQRKIGSLFNVRQYPTAYLIKPGGQIANVTIGYRPGDEKKVEQEILEMLPPAAGGVVPAEKEEGASQSKSEPEDGSR